MNSKCISAIAMLAATLIFSTQFLAAQDDTIPPVIALFPYFCPDKEDAKAFSYARYAVPDLLRERFLLQKRFALIEKREIVGMITALGKDLEEDLGDDTRLAVAKNSGADYFVFGYLVREQDGLKIFHHLIEVVTGRTLHIESQSLPEGRDLINRMEDSVLNFDTRTKNELPLRMTRSVPAPERSGFSLETTVGVVFFPEPAYASLKPSIAADLFVAHTPQNQETWSFGVDFGLTHLGNKDETTSKISIVLLSAVARGTAKIPIGTAFDTVFSLDFGASLYFGRVNEELLSYLRPTARAGVLFDFVRTDSITAGLGVRVAYTTNAYQDQDMVTIAPEVKIAFRF